ncbi:phage antirepressor KilAC domain-containing protein [Clostridium sporogenes]|uniref:Phage antirepressor Ant n=1 Tax=Clostridium botulinum TaxID=1491 RepID=A0A6M0SX15_CLOBO|nr:phage antirepressor KilAC domain-containing protein [Clostridium sporogenes]NFA59505.1 phage antirepressor Ant [Clostridium botulinum]NFI74689.1 phage antirepressor Ant [Clostridium sporogenes]NFL71176.1 phage antirepressor Ant [Clostridium sporogenes]NFM24988.1 phage antirepressor Ant [Clostridium sporogenes]NFP62449.1 phage antirepressor Ant [Clostridium sporogenes]
MNTLQVFKNNEFGEVKTIQNENGIWFVGNEISKILGYSNYRNAIVNHVDEEDKMCTQIEYAGQKRKITIINESGLYSLVLSSKLPTAKKFKRWVTSEVLPQIRQTGGYIPTNKDETEEDILAKAILIAQKTIEKKNKIIEEQKPLVSFANKVATSQNSLLVREVAKLASREGLNIGEKRLWNKLREWGLILKNSTEPKQYGIERGIFEVVEGTKESSKGTFTYKTTRVTGKGQVYIISKLEKEFRG